MHNTDHSAERLAFLDALRGLAALMVVIAHGIYWHSDFQTHALPWFNLGQFGVELFVLISGFIIPVSLERLGSLRQFWIRRICRLYPLYWTCLAGVAAGRAMGILAESTFFPATITSGTILTNATMTQFVLGYGNLLGVAWSLGFEEFFYLLVAVLFALRLYKRSTAIAVGLLLTSGLLAIAGSAGGLLVSYLATMFVGTVLHRATYSDGSPSIAYTTVALAIGVTMLRLRSELPGIVAAHVGAYVVFCAALRLRQARYPAWTLYLGRISYSLYLTHLFVIAMLPPLSGLLPSLAAWIIVTVLVSAATYYCIEQPWIALGRRITARPQTARLVAQAFAD